MTNLTVLYATDELTSRLHATRIARDWEVFHPTSINEALAMTVYYAPHAVVIDGDSDWLNELALNLTSMTGPSARLKDIVVRLSDVPLDLEIPDYIDFHELPAQTSAEELASVLHELNMQRERSGWLDRSLAV